MGKRKKGQAPSQRQLRVGELLRQGIADILVRDMVADPELERFRVTVPQVLVSPDLRVAVCYVIPLGGGYSDDIVRVLARHAGFIRGALSSRLALRYTPALRFRYDGTFDEYAKIDRLLSSCGHGSSAVMPNI